MDDYWKQSLQRIPDDHFSSAAETYTVLNIWHDPQDGTDRFERTNVEKKSLREWARAGAQVSDEKGPRLVFQGLVVSTTKYNDFPVVISLLDLSYVADTLGISSALVPLLFAPYTTYSTLNQQLSWYYGRPGLRAVASTRAAGNYTRAIIITTEKTLPILEKDLSRLSCFATHPFMLVLAIRAITIRESESIVLQTIKSLQETELLTGFHAWYGDDIETKSSSSSSDPESIDLARLSKKAGSYAANLGNFKILQTRLGSLRDMMYTENNLKWHSHFDSQYQPVYRQQSEEMVEMDSIFEAMNQGLLASISEYQNRARSLQSVIFTLIAKDDTNASIDLAKESRAIAMATRNDGTSMKTIAIMTMIFLPATFYAALFAVPTLQWQQSPVIQSKFWIYWVFTVPSTLVVLLTWYFIVTRQVKKEIRRQDGEHIRNRAKLHWRIHDTDTEIQSDVGQMQPPQDINLGNLTKRMRRFVKPAMNEHTSRSAA